MGTSASRAALAHLRTIAAALAAFALTLGLAPSLLFAEEFEPAGALASVAVGSAPTASKGSSEAATLNSSVPTGNEGSVLASALAGPTASILSADVTLDASDPLIGSFTVDGLTYAVNSDGLALVSVDPAAVSDGAIAIPASVAYNDVAYDATSIAPYAFYLSGAAQVELPATIVSVGDRAFRSSDVERVEVDAGNPNLTSFDGAIYSADLHRLLLIPEGRAGAVLLPSEAEVVQASKFSHCSLVDAISVEEGGANFASWDGLLYDASGTTLLRVPAGATEITIRDGCTTIAAGALEGCASLERIHAPASVTSISPDVFTSIPTIALPVQTALRDEENPGVASSLLGQVNAFTDFPEGAPSDEVETRTASQDDASSGVASVLTDQVNASTDFIPQLTAMVALSTIDDDLPEINSASIEVVLPEGVDRSMWKTMGFTVSLVAETGTAIPDGAAPIASDQESARVSRAGQWPEYTFHLWGAESYLWRMWDRGYTQMLEERVYEDSHFVADDVENWSATAVSIGYWRDDFTHGVQLLPYKKGYTLKRFYYADGSTVSTGVGYQNSASLTCEWRPNAYTIALDARGGIISQPSIAAAYDQDVVLPAPEERAGYEFLGWNTAVDGSGTAYQPGTVRNLTDADKVTVTLYAQWSYSLGFDTSSEPSDADYPGDAMDAKPIVTDDGQLPIEDPKRPGYVFEGWVIPSADGMEAVDQELVYEGGDGKWYVDASKLPDYVGDDGRVELTARWTSVISVDVPQSVTFYADTVTQGQESREGAASGAFGQNKVANQSEVDLRVVGLESSAVETTDTTLGADSILKKASAAIPSSSAGKLFSLYPTDKLLDADELQDSDLKFEAKSADAVDFDLDDMLLEASFASDSFTIPAGDTLNMGYRLNLTETGQQLDYDKLSTLEDGQSAAIANVSYCFAADNPGFWIDDKTLGRIGLGTIKADAERLSAGYAEAEATGTLEQWKATDPTYLRYKGYMDSQGKLPDHLNRKPGPYFQLKNGASVFDMQLLGICQDVRDSDGKRAGLTFGFLEIYAVDEVCADGSSFGSYVDPATGSTVSTSVMNAGAASSNVGSWQASGLRRYLRTTFSNQLPENVREAIEPVRKVQQRGGTEGNGLQVSPDLSKPASEQNSAETVFLPSAFEVFGQRDPAGHSFEGNEDETAANGSFQYEAYQGGNDGSLYNLLAWKYFASTPEDWSAPARTVWWLRSASRGTANWWVVTNNGGRNGGQPSNASWGVAPCFCL